jgi:hypothetical protein
MSEETKSTVQLTPEELQQLNTIKSQANNITFALGENQIRKEMLLDSYKNSLIQEQEFMNRLNIKYGEGSIDINTGIITNE